MYWTVAWYAKGAYREKWFKTLDEARAFARKVGGDVYGQEG